MFIFHKCGTEIISKTHVGINPLYILNTGLDIVTTNDTDTHNAFI